MKDKSKILKRIAFAFICLFTFAVSNVNAEVWIGNDSLSDNSPISVGGGTATWDKTKKELTLDGVNLTMNSGANAIVDLISESSVTLILKGENTLVNSGNYYGIYASGNLTIKGTGSLKITSATRTIRAAGSLVVDGTKLDLTATNNQNNIYALEADAITIQNQADVKVQAKGVSIGTFSTLTVNDSKVEVTSTANFHSAILVNNTKSDGSIIVKNSNIKAKSAYASIEAQKDATIEESTIDLSSGYYGIKASGKVSLKDSDFTTQKVKENAISGTSISLNNTTMNAYTEYKTFSVLPTFTNLGDNLIFVSATADGTSAEAVESSDNTAISGAKTVRILSPSQVATITVEADENSVVSLDKTTIVPKKDTVSVTISAEDGYKLVSVLVDEKEMLPLTDNKLTISDINKDTKITVVTKEKDAISTKEPTIDTTEDVKEVKIGVKESVDKDTLNKAIENAGIDTSSIDTVVDIDVTNLDEAAVSQEAKASINTLVDRKGYTVASYFDITLNVENAIAGNVVGTLSELDKAITFNIALPSELLNTSKDVIRTYYVIRYHDGVAEILPATLEGNMLTFASNKFSTYAIAYVDTKVNDDKDNSSTKPNNTSNIKTNNVETIKNPQTYDDIMLYIVTGAISLIALGGALVYRKKFN